MIDLNAISPSLALIILTFLSVVYFAYQVYARILDLSDFNSEIEDIRSRYKKIEGVITRAEINAGYFFQGVNISDSSDEDDFLKEKAISYMEDVNYVNNGILINYEYQYNDEVWEGHALNLVSTDKDKDIAMKLKTGNRVAIMVDPENPSYSYLSISSTSDVAEYFSKITPYNRLYVSLVSLIVSVYIHFTI